MKNTKKALEISGIVELTNDEAAEKNGGWGRWFVWCVTFAASRGDRKQADQSANNYTQFTGDTW
jgi:hypothetical protein